MTRENRINDMLNMETYMSKWKKPQALDFVYVLIPAVPMLVSGTIGFRGLASMAEGELLLGVR